MPVIEGRTNTSDMFKDVWNEQSDCMVMGIDFYNAEIKTTRLRR